MKTKHLAILFAGIMIVFIIWSVTDMTCKPCIIPTDAPDNYACPTVCNPEPRWYSWFR